MYKEATSVSAFFSFVIRLQPVFFIPPNPLRPECFLSLCLLLSFPLVIFGRLLSYIKVNGPQQHSVSQHVQTVLVAGPVLFTPALRCDGCPSGDDVFPRDAFGLNHTPPQAVVDRLEHLRNCSVYSHVTLLECSSQLFV